ncbi:MAG: hypothetical protein ABIN89_00815 [Chitinophagaceae bacterium]
MPVKITSITDATTGEILPEDLNAMKNRFINEADLVRLKGSQPITKKYSVAVMKDELKNLIAFYEANGGLDVIRINFAVHPDGFSACNETDYSNSLTVVIEAESFINPDNPKNGTLAHSNHHDFVVIPGYNGFPPVGQVHADAACCPSTNP